MAKITQVKILCDQCIRLGLEDHEGVEHHVNGQRGTVVALCDNHYEELLKPLSDLLEHMKQGKGRPKAAKPSKAPSKAPEAETCLECGKVFSTETGYKRPKQGLTLHVRREHS